MSTSRSLLDQSQHKRHRRPATGSAQYANRPTTEIKGGVPIVPPPCVSHVRRGRPGGRFQSGARRIPLKASIQSCRAWCAGTSGESRQTWSNKEWRRSAIIRGRSLRQVFSLSAVFLTWSNHLMTNIRRCDVIWKTWIFSLSTFVTAQVSDP